MDEVLGEINADRTFAKPLSWCDHALVVEADDRELLTRSDAAGDGRIYVQGPSSISASLILDPQPGQWNLDMAAAPGGKASHVAALMNNDGKLSVVEPIKKRMYRLADNLKRLGVSISKTYLMDGRKVGVKVPDRFDCIMLDAPCSSESRMRADEPKSKSYWSERKIREQSRKQAGLIVSAFQALKPEGVMLYCTCSFAPEENEMIVQHLLNEVGEQATVLPIEMPNGFPNDRLQRGLTEFNEKQFDESLSSTLRILPNDLFDGFYMARIRKAGDFE